MRICIYTQDISSYLGGIQTVVSSVAAELVESGHAVTIICPSSDSRQKQKRILDDRIQVVRIGSLSEVSRWRLRKLFAKIILAGLKRYGPGAPPRFLNPFLKWLFLRRPEAAGVVSYIRNESFDVVVGAGAQQSLMVSLVAPKLHCRTVGWAHATYSAYFETRGENLFGLATLASAHYPELDTVLVLNSADRGKFSLGLGVRATVFENPVGPFDRPTVANADSKVIVYVGRINFSSKGVDLLVKAFRRVNAKHPDWKLRIYGDGLDRTDLERQIHAEGLEGWIDLMGVTDDVFGALSSGSIFAFPSRSEGFGIALVEAMQMGLPSVSFASDGPRDILTNGVTGFLVEGQDVSEFAQRIIQLIEDRELRLTMGEAAARASVAYNPEHLVPKFLSLIGRDV